MSIIKILIATVHIEYLKVEYVVDLGREFNNWENRDNFVS